eukprot:c20536_g1_i1 orf=2-1183(-)
MAMLFTIRNFGKGFQRHIAWFSLANPVLVECNDALLESNFQGRVFDRCCHAASSPVNPSLMVGNEDTSVQETVGNASYGYGETQFNSANSCLWEENINHGSKLNTQLGKIPHTSSTPQMVQAHSRSWATMCIEEALTCLQHIHELPSIEDFIYILQKCRKERVLGFLTCIQTHLCNSGLEASGVLGNILVQLFVECKSLANSHQVFNKLVHPDEYSWTYLIQGYNEYGDFENALQLFTTMQAASVCPTKYTYVAILKACAGKKYLHLSQEIHVKIIKEKLETDPFIVNTLVGVYAKCGSLPEARKVFQGLLIPTVVSWTALIAGYVEHGLGEEALHCLGQMQLEGICPNAFTFACGLNTCASVGAVDRGHLIHSVIVIDKYGDDMYVGNALVDM